MPNSVIQITSEQVDVSNNATIDAEGFIVCNGLRVMPLKSIMMFQNEQGGGFNEADEKGWKLLFTNIFKQGNPAEILLACETVFNQNISLNETDKKKIIGYCYEALESRLKQEDSIVEAATQNIEALGEDKITSLQNAMNQGIVVTQNEIEDAKDHGKAIYDLSQGASKPDVGAILQNEQQQQQQQQEQQQQQQIMLEDAEGKKNNELRKTITARTVDISGAEDTSKIVILAKDRAENYINTLPYTKISAEAFLYMYQHQDFFKNGVLPDCLPAGFFVQHINENGKDVTILRFDKKKQADEKSLEPYKHCAVHKKTNRELSTRKLPSDITAQIKSLALPNNISQKLGRVPDQQINLLLKILSNIKETHEGDNLYEKILNRFILPPTRDCSELCDEKSLTDLINISKYDTAKLNWWLNCVEGDQNVSLSESHAFFEQFCVEMKEPFHLALPSGKCPILKESIGNMQVLLFKVSDIVRGSRFPQDQLCQLSGLDINTAWLAMHNHEYKMVNKDMFVEFPPPSDKQTQKQKEQIQIDNQRKYFLKSLYANNSNNSIEENDEEFVPKLGRAHATFGKMRQVGISALGDGPLRGVYIGSPPAEIQSTDGQPIDVNFMHVAQECKLKYTDVSITKDFQTMLDNQANHAPSREENKQALSLHSEILRIPGINLIGGVPDKSGCLSKNSLLLDKILTRNHAAYHNKSDEGFIQKYVTFVQVMNKPCEYKNGTEAGENDSKVIKRNNILCCLFATSDYPEKLKEWQNYEDFISKYPCFSDLDNNQLGLLAEILSDSNFDITVEQLSQSAAAILKASKDEEDKYAVLTKDGVRKIVRNNCLGVTFVDLDSDAFKQDQVDKYKLQISKEIQQGVTELFQSIGSDMIDGDYTDIADCAGMIISRLDELQSIGDYTEIDGGNNSKKLMKKAIYSMLGGDAIRKKIEAPLAEYKRLRDESDIEPDYTGVQQKEQFKHEVKKKDESIKRETKKTDDDLGGLKIALKSHTEAIERAKNADAVQIQTEKKTQHILDFDFQKYNEEFDEFATKLEEEETSLIKIRTKLREYQDVLPEDDSKDGKISSRAKCTKEIDEIDKKLKEIDELKQNHDELFSKSGEIGQELEKYASTDGIDAQKLTELENEFNKLFDKARFDLGNKSSEESKQNLENYEKRVNAEITGFAETAHEAMALRAKETKPQKMQREKDRILMALCDTIDKLRGPLMTPTLSKAGKMVRDDMKAVFQKSLAYIAQPTDSIANIVEEQLLNTGLNKDQVKAIVDKIRGGKMYESVQKANKTLDGIGKFVQCFGRRDSSNRDSFQPSDFQKVLVSYATKPEERDSFFLAMVSIYGGNTKLNQQNFLKPSELFNLLVDQNEHRATQDSKNVMFTCVKNLLINYSKYLTTNDGRPCNKEFIKNVIADGKSDQNEFLDDLFKSVSGEKGQAIKQVEDIIQFSELCKNNESIKKGLSTIVKDPGKRSKLQEFILAPHKNTDNKALTQAVVTALSSDCSDELSSIIIRCGDSPSKKKLTNKEKLTNEQLKTLIVKLKSVDGAILKKIDGYLQPKGVTAPSLEWLNKVVNKKGLIDKGLLDEIKKYSEEQRKQLLETKEVSRVKVELAKYFTETKSDPRLKDPEDFCQEIAIDFKYINDVGLGKIQPFGKAIGDMSQQEINDQLTYRNVMINNPDLDETTRYVAKLNAIALYREAMFRATGVMPNSTQVMNVVMQAKVKLAGIAFQIETGEGKSISNPLAAALLHSEGFSVNLFTASELLIDQDMGKSKVFWEYLGVPVARIDAKSTESQYESKGVHYTTAAQFALYDAALTSKGVDTKKLFENMAGAYDESDQIFYNTKVDFRYSTQLDPKKTLEKMHYQYINEIYATPAISKLFKEVHKFQRLYREADSDQKRDKIAKQAHEVTAKITKFAKDKLREFGCNESLYGDSARVAMLLASADKVDIMLKAKAGNSSYRPFIVEALEDPKTKAITNRVVLLNDEGQPARGSVFADGMHQLMCDRLERESLEKGELKEFDFMPQCDCISKSSANLEIKKHKKFVGMTGTLGSSTLINEFSKTNPIFTVISPRHYRKLRKDEIPQILDNESQQLARIQKIVGKSSNKPAIVFSDDTKEFASILEHLKQNNEDATIITMTAEGHCRYTYSSTTKEWVSKIIPNEEFESLVKEAGGGNNKTDNKKVITLATSYVGRGTDFTPPIKTGVIATFNADPLITDQLRGRLGRHGAAGTVYCVHNMEKIKEQQKTLKDPDKLKTNRARNKALTALQEAHITKLAGNLSDFCKKEELFNKVHSVIDGKLIALGSKPKTEISDEERSVQMAILHRQKCDLIRYADDWKNSTTPDGYKEELIKYCEAKKIQCNLQAVDLPNLNPVEGNTRKLTDKEIFCKWGGKNLAQNCSRIKGSEELLSKILLMHGGAMTEESIKDDLVNALQHIAHSNIFRKFPSYKTMSASDMSDLIQSFIQPYVQYCKSHLGLKSVIEGAIKQHILELGGLKNNKNTYLFGLSNQLLELNGEPIISMVSAAEAAEENNTKVSDAKIKITDFLNALNRFEKANIIDKIAKNTPTGIPAIDANVMVVRKLESGLFRGENSFGDTPAFKDLLKEISKSNTAQRRNNA